MSVTSHGKFYCWTSIELHVHVACLVEVVIVATSAQIHVSRFIVVVEVTVIVSSAKIHVGRPIFPMHSCKKGDAG